MRLERLVRSGSEGILRLAALPESGFAMQIVSARPKQVQGRLLSVLVMDSTLIRPLADDIRRLQFWVLSSGSYSHKLSPSCSILSPGASSPLNYTKRCSRNLSIFFPEYSYQPFFHIPLSSALLASVRIDLDRLGFEALAAHRDSTAQRTNILSRGKHHRRECA